MVPLFRIPPARLGPHGSLNSSGAGTVWAPFWRPSRSDWYELGTGFNDEISGIRLNSYRAGTVWPPFWRSSRSDWYELGTRFGDKMSDIEKYITKIFRKTLKTYVNKHKIKI